MKLAAIYNVWDGEELLRGSVELIKDHVDLFIFVWQDVSNFGEHYNPIPNLNLPEGINKILVKYDPQYQCGFPNECAKRNLGLYTAKENNCTHFLHLDCDEYYENFADAKQKYLTTGAHGSVCKLFTYFKKPTLRFESEDGYFVPFIHKLFPDTIAGKRGPVDYPFHVDPTRKINQQDVVLLDVHMQHFSWVRLDIERKARNSSAKYNLEEGTMLKDYQNNEVGPGFYVKDYDKKLIEVPNYFGITITG